MLMGPAFTPVYPDVEIMKLGPGQALDLTVHFNEKSAGTHARYAMVAAVGMRKVDDASHHLRFDVLDGRTPKEVLHDPGRPRRARAARAHALAHQLRRPAQVHVLVNCSLREKPTSRRRVPT